MNDTVLEELWHIKDDIAKSCGYDMHTLFERLKAVQHAHPDRVVKFKGDKYEHTQCTSQVAETSTPYLNGK